MNEFLATAPFDLYELSLFRAVVQHGSFTKAAQAAGLTQSAITRQVQGMENSLGVSLLERTTRSVRPTPAGEFLFDESARLLGDVDQSLRRLKEEFAGARKEIRIGVSRSIGLAHLPGFFHANVRRASKVTFRVSSQSSPEILAALESNDLDVGLLSPPQRLSRTMIITHRFTDAFSLIAPAHLADEFAALPESQSVRTRWLTEQSWLLLEQRTNSGQRLRNWMSQLGLKIEPTMELDSFDMIITLVTLGMGVSFVPIRTLALYGQKKALARISLPDRFERELVVIMRRHRKRPDHLVSFVENILF
jgi:DNA-binding transcriptional LysR family regulator